MNKWKFREERGTKFWERDIHNATLRVFQKEEGEYNIEVLVEGRTVIRDKTSLLGSAKLLAGTMYMAYLGKKADENVQTKR